MDEEECRTEGKITTVRDNLENQARLKMFLENGIEFGQPLAILDYLSNGGSLDRTLYLEHRDLFIKSLEELNGIVIKKKLEKSDNGFEVFKEMLKNNISQYMSLNGKCPQK